MGRTGILRVIERSDEALLAALDDEPEAFAVFYRRHVTALLGYFVRRTRDPELSGLGWVGEGDPPGARAAVRAAQGVMQVR